MGHVQHLSLESLVKMDHFQKEPPLNLKGTTGGKGVERGQTHPKGTDRKSYSDCMSLWVIRDLAGQGRRSYLSVVTPIADKRDISPFIRLPRRILSGKDVGFDELVGETL